MSNEIKDLEAPRANLGELMDAMLKESSKTGLDRVRTVLAMRMNQYLDIPLTEAEVKKLYKSFMDIEVGSSTGLVMICDRRKCLYRDRCVLFSSAKAPEGMECLHENKVMTKAMDSYMTSLEIDIDNYPEMVMVNQLVEYELIEHRCNAILSYEHRNMKMETVVGIDDDGNIVTKEEVSHALTIKMMIYKNKIQLLQDFTATRREQYKKKAALKEIGSGPSKVMSSMKKKLEDLKSGRVDPEAVQAELNSLSDIDEMGDF